MEGFMGPLPCTEEKVWSFADYHETVHGYPHTVVPKEVSGCLTYTDNMKPTWCVVKMREEKVE